MTGQNLTPSEARFSVVIRAFNEERHLPVLLQAIEGQTVRPAEVVLVDSGSTDASVRIARDYGARVLHIAKNDFSFGRSLNMGIEATGSDFIVIASAHVYPTDNGWLERILQPFKDAGVALVYGGQQGNGRTKFSEHQVFRQWFPPVSSSDQTHAFCNNGNAAVRRSVWETLRYDEQVPGLEDVHWAKRAMERGFRIVYQADASVVHVHEETYAQVYRRYRREAIGLRSVFPWEGMTLSHAAGLFVRAVRSDREQARREGVLGRERGSILRFRAAQYWGAYRGLGWRGLLTSDLKSRLYYSGETSREVARTPVEVPVPRKDAE